MQAVQPKAGTPSVVAEGAPQGAAPQAAPPGSGLMMLLPLLILVPFLFLSSRQRKKEAEARSKLKKGDRVSTTAGIVGELVEMGARTAKLKIAPGVNIEVLSSTLTPFDPVAADKAATKDGAPAGKAAEKA
jgi:preprotein translocase subunit YajC